MKPLVSLITLSVLTGLASRSHFRYGHDMAKNGEVVFETSNAFHVIARVQFRSGDPVQVDLLSTPKGLRWKCACSSKKNFFCPHAVAASLALLGQASGRAED